MLAAAGIGVVLAVMGQSGGGHSAGGAVAALESLASSIHMPSSSSAGARHAAVHWAKAQQGCPYVWGGTGPCGAGFDCSGLTMEAYAAAGVSIPRTSGEQWAWGVQNGKQVPMSGLLPGDEVFYPGADGTVTDPGHVVMYIGHGKIIEAYAQGTPVHIVALGSMPGEQNPVGAIDPTAGA